MHITTSDVTTYEYAGHVTQSTTATVDFKTTAAVSLHVNSGQVNVVCQNAAHRAWRGSGRDFDSFAAARDGYKSAAMKVAIEEAERVLVGGGTEIAA